MRHTAIALLCVLPLTACFSRRAAIVQPSYESSGIRIFHSSSDHPGSKGAYVFGALRIEGARKTEASQRFALTMDYGRDVNNNGMLEAEEVLDTDRIQDGSMPFTYRIDELTIAPGPGRAMHRLRIEFDGQEPFRYERRELAQQGK